MDCMGIFWDLVDKRDVTLVPNNTKCQDNDRLINGCSQ